MGQTDQGLADSGVIFAGQMGQQNLAYPVPSKPGQRIPGVDPKTPAQQVAEFRCLRLGDV